MALHSDRARRRPTANLGHPGRRDPANTHRHRPAPRMAEWLGKGTAIPHDIAIKQHVRSNARLCNDLDHTRPAAIRVGPGHDNTRSQDRNAITVDRLAGQPILSRWRRCRERRGVGRPVLIAEGTAAGVGQHTGHTDTRIDP